MNYYDDGLPPVPGQTQQQSAQAAQSSADSTLISANDNYPTQSNAYASTTAQQPRVEQSYYQAETYPKYRSEAYTNYRPQHSAQTVTVAPRKTSSGASSLMLGLLGGVVGAIGLTLVLGLTGVIGFKGTSTQQKSATSNAAIQISADTDDITVASAVAAKATPSVAAIYCDYDDGSGMGSGVILDTDGNILTNYHVIEGAKSISVTIEDKSYDATVVGTDSSSDLAVVHAELGSDIVTPMEIGDSSALAVGDWVMTVGSPFGLEQSCSQGIVSSLYRNELMSSTSGNTIYANLIQVDAAINPGNSGGALVNSEGQLVGICTLYSSDTQSFAGIGFAIPGNYAVDIANKIISGEKVTHAYIGVSMQTVNAENAQANNLAVDEGAYVAQVMEGGPAEAAGIQEGDVITEIAGEKIASADAVILAVRSHSIGETVQVKAMRGDKEMTFDVTLTDDTALQELQETERNTTQQQQYNYDFNDQQQFDYDYNNQQQYDYDYNDTYNFDQFLEELYDMMGENGNGNGNGYRSPFGN